jgi:two-component system, LuxR family, sensor kinase FixL
VSNSLSLMVALEALQLVFIAALTLQWLSGRRSRELLARQRAGADQRTGALVHELNQPLTAILSNAQAAQRFLASDRLDVQELREILDDIVTDDKRAAGIVRRLGGVLKTGGSDAPATDDPRSGVDKDSGAGRERAP